MLVYPILRGLRSKRSGAVCDSYTYHNVLRQNRSGIRDAIGQVMVFRIDVESVGSKTRISIAGELLAEGVLELERALATTADALELDLTDLTIADPDGVGVLRRLIDNGATTIGVSPFIKYLLAILWRRSRRNNQNETGNIESWCCPLVPAPGPAVLEGTWMIMPADPGEFDGFTYQARFDSSGDLVAITGSRPDGQGYAGY